MGYFEPDDTEYVTVKLTAKDWLMLLLAIKDRHSGIKDARLRDGYARLIAGISEQVRGEE